MAAVRRDALHPTVERRVRIIVVGIGFGDHIGLGVFGLRAAAVGMRAAGDGAVAVVILDVAALPDRVDGLGAVCMINDNRVARLILRSSRSRTVSPALEGIAFSGRDLNTADKDSLCRRCIKCRNRLTIRLTGAAIRIIMQFIDWQPDGIDGLGRIVLGQYDRLAALVPRSRSIRLVRPATVIIARAGQLRSINIMRETSFRRGRRVVREPRAVRAVVPLIKQLVGILGSVAVSRKGRYRQHTEHHNQN